MQDVLNRRLLFKTNRRQCSIEAITIVSSFLELGEETVDLTKICGSAENVVKTETQQTFVNGLLGFFYYFRHLYSAGARVYYHNNCMGAIDMPTASPICTAH